MIHINTTNGKILYGLTFKTNGAWDWSIHLRLNDNTLRTIRKRPDNIVKPKCYYTRIDISDDDVLCGKLLDRFGWDGVDAFRALQLSSKANEQE